MQPTAQSPRIVIDGSEPELAELMRHEPDIVAEADAFRAAITKWLASAPRSALDGTNVSAELLRWSRERFGAAPPSSARHSPRRRREPARRAA